MANEERRAALVETVKEFVLKYAHDGTRGHVQRVRARKISDKSAEMVLQLLMKAAAPHKPRTGAAGRAEARARALRDVAEVEAWLQDTTTPHDLELLLADAPAKRVEQAEPLRPMVEAATAAAAEPANDDETGEDVAGEDVADDDLRDDDDDVGDDDGEDGEDGDTEDDMEVDAFVEEVDASGGVVVLEDVEDDVEDEDSDDDVEDVVGDVDDVAFAAQDLLRLGHSSRSRSSQSRSSRSLLAMDPWDDVARSIYASWSGVRWHGVQVAHDEAGLRGLRATVEIPSNTLVTVYDGHRLGYGVAAKREACGLDEQTHLNETDGWYTDGLPLVRAWEADPGGRAVRGRGLAAFVNHSSTPNGEFVSHNQAIYYKSRNAITAGEWLTACYGKRQSPAFRVAMGLARFRLAPYPGTLIKGLSVVIEHSRSPIALGQPTPLGYAWHSLESTHGWSITLQDGRPLFQVRASTLGEAVGLGLFAARPFRSGEVLGSLDGGDGLRAEGSCLVGDRHRDVSRADSGLQFANCGRGKRPHNARLAGHTVRALKPIRAEEEILCGYGSGYWATERARQRAAAAASVASAEMPPR